MECPWPGRGEWESFNSHVAGTFVYPLSITGPLWGESTTPLQVEEQATEPVG